MIDSNNLPQKVRGLVYLAQNTSSYNVPQFVVATKNSDGIMQIWDATNNWREFEAQDIQHVLDTLNSDVFVRPCPTVPRHGFVDSVRIRNPTLADIEQILDATLAADPDGCILVMPYVECDYNAIMTKVGIAIGPGHDGATSGKNSLYFPLASNDFNSMFYTHYIDSVIADHPYVEIVGCLRNYSYKLVQLRDGQTPPNGNGNYLPRNVPDSDTILRTDDYPNLLDWERVMLASDPATTVVHHPGGTRVSHYAHHAIARNIPVVFNADFDAPYTATGEMQPKIDRGAFNRGLLAGMVSKIEKYSEEIDHILFAAHNASLSPSTTTSMLLGRAVISLLRVGTAACIGEYRHYHKIKRKRKPARNTVYRRVLNMESSNSYLKLRGRLADVFEAFHSGAWSVNYGGLPWARCAKSIIELDEALVAYAKAGAYADPATLVVALHRAINQAHNNGWWLNKFANSTVANEYAQARAERQLIGALVSYKFATKMAVCNNNEYIDVFTAELLKRIARAKPIVSDHSMVTYTDDPPPVKDAPDEADAPVSEPDCNAAEPSNEDVFEAACNTFVDTPDKITAATVLLAAPPFNHGPVKLNGGAITHKIESDLEFRLLVNFLIVPNKLDLCNLDEIKIQVRGTNPQELAYGGYIQIGAHVRSCCRTVYMGFDCSANVAISIRNMLSETHTKSYSSDSIYMQVHEDNRMSALERLQKASALTDPRLSHFAAILMRSLAHAPKEEIQDTSNAT